MVTTILYYYIMPIQNISLMERAIVNAGVGAVAPIIRKYAPAALAGFVVDNIRAGLSASIAQVKDYNQAYSQSAKASLRSATATIPRALKRTFEQAFENTKPPKSTPPNLRPKTPKRRKLAWKWNVPARSYYSRRRSTRKTFRQSSKYWRRYYQKGAPYQARPRLIRRNASKKKTRKN